MNPLIEEHDPLPDCDCHRCAIAERDRWRELHRVIAEENGLSPADWPDHGNAPLAIAAHYMLLRNAAERHEKDHERYQWLRQGLRLDEDYLHTRVELNYSGLSLHRWRKGVDQVPTDIDSAVDAARAK